MCFIKSSHSYTSFSKPPGKGKGKGTGKVHPRTGYEVPEGE